MKTVLIMTSLSYCMAILCSRGACLGPLWVPGSANSKGRQALVEALEEDASLADILAADVAAALALPGYW